MITASIDLNKIDKSHLVPGKNGASYLRMVLSEKKSQYGDDGYIAQSVSKEKRDKGVKGPILGGFKKWDKPKEDKTPWD